MKTSLIRKDLTGKVIGYALTAETPEDDDDDFYMSNRGGTGHGDDSYSDADTGL